MGPGGPSGEGGNSRVLHILGELRAATPERRDVMVADMKARGLRPDVIDELAAIAAASPAPSPRAVFDALLTIPDAL